MTMITRGLFAELRADVAVAAIVGGVGTAPDRIYPLLIPQKVVDQSQMSAIVYAINGVQRGTTYCETDKVVKSTLTIDCYSKVYLTARTLAAAVQAALIDFRGMLGGLVEVRWASLVTEFDLLDIEPGLFRVSQSWDVWHLDD